MESEIFLLPHSLVILKFKTFFYFIPHSCFCIYDVPIHITLNPLILENLKQVN